MAQVYSKLKNYLDDKKSSKDDFINSYLEEEIVNSEVYDKKYRLRKVVILSRHNMRSPLSNSSSVLDKVTD